MTMDIDGLAPKMEKDCSEMVDARMPSILGVAKKGQLQDAIDQLLVLEKQTRTAADLASNSKVLLAIVNVCHEAGNYKLLCEYLVLLSKKHGLLKQAITRMVQRVVELLDKTPSKATKLELIDTLRNVTEGKIYVEVERARVTRLLAKIKEDEGKIADAADTLQELQVETFGSMDRREKVDFILEQMRLCLAKEDYTRVQIISKKITSRFFSDEAHADLKLRFYTLMLQHALHGNDYMAACRCYQQMYNTKSVQDDEAQWSDKLQNMVYYIVLAPFDHEQADLIHRVYTDARLQRLPELHAFLKSFVTDELLHWSAVEQQFGAALRRSPAFDGKTPKSTERYADLRKRVVEHNVRVIAKYYTEISIKRLAELLELPPAEAGEVLSSLVVAKTVFARINRPAGTVKFAPPKAPADVITEWSTNIGTLLDMIQKTCHLIQKEEMVHSITAAPQS